MPRLGIEPTSVELHRTCRSFLKNALPSELHGRGNHPIDDVGTGYIFGCKVWLDPHGPVQQHNVRLSDLTLTKTCFSHIWSPWHVSPWPDPEASPRRSGSWWSSATPSWPPCRCSPPDPSPPGSRWWLITCASGSCRLSCWFGNKYFNVLKGAQ